MSTKELILAEGPVTVEVSGFTLVHQGKTHSCKNGGDIANGCVDCAYYPAYIYSIEHEDCVKNSRK